MFSWFRRSSKPPERKRKATASKRGEPHVESGPAPLPEVVAEGNSHADWSEWESSMMGLDSQMGDLPPTSTVYEKDASSRYTKPAPLMDEDAFDRVTKNRS
jgi:hypothetical protein